MYTAVKWKQLFIAHFGIIILISAQQKLYQPHANQTEYILLRDGGGGGKYRSCRDKIKKSYIIKSATLSNMKNIDDKNINYFITENKMQF